MGNGNMAEITVLIHGTFANPQFSDPEAPPADEWWKITEGDRTHELTTADRLQGELDSRQTHGAKTVWRPSRRDPEIQYKDLGEWSGMNRHRARKKAAKDLRLALGKIADGRWCTPEQPLLVNFVAHSHGGNVALEAMKKLPDNVKPRRVCLLGTPLVWRYTDPRFVYLAMVLFVTGTAILDMYDADSPGKALGSLLITVTVFWLTFALIQGIRLLFKPFAGRPAYGPKPDELDEMLDGTKVSLFISDEDEADLMMHLGAAPMDTYRALIGGKGWITRTEIVDGKLTTMPVPLSRIIALFPLRIFEVFIIRPIFYVAVLPLLEVLLERFALGFSTHSVMFRNYEMVSWTGKDPYAESVQRVQVPAALLRSASSRDHAMTDRIQDIASRRLVLWNSEVDSRPQTSDERIAQLRFVMTEAATGLKQQVHLSHSGYYTSPEIIAAVAERIAAPDAVVVDLRATVDLGIKVTHF